MENKITLTNEQKQEIVDLYWDDFYAINIIEWFEEYYPQEVKEALNQTLETYEITKPEWKKICKRADMLDCEANETTEEVELDTMNILLEKFDIDTERNYV